MVYLFGSTGQLCNRLFNISGFIANSRSFQYKILCTGFEEYYDLFEPINEVALIHNIRFLTKDDVLTTKLIHVQKRTISKLRFLTKVFKIKYYTNTGDLNTPEFRKIVENKKVYITGWPYWDVQSFIKYSPFIKEVFTPRQKYIDNVNLLLEKETGKYTDLVGVHIRRGDYKTYKGGAYYFSDEFYKTKMREVHRFLSEECRTPLFIICSNEKVLLENFELPFIVSNLEAIEDLVLLSKCNFIFGPPSTFSMWSSFYGNVPSVWITTDAPLFRNDFSPIVAPNTYANGKNIID